MLLTKEQNLLNCLLVLVLDRELERFDKESSNGTQIIANSEGSLKVDRECLRQVVGVFVEVFDPHLSKLISSDQ